MPYAVYVNHPTSKARVHSTGCSEYARRKADVTGNGYWQSGFPSLRRALAYAKNTGKKNVSQCRKCI